MRGGNRSAKTEHQRHLSGSRQRPYQHQQPILQHEQPDEPASLSGREREYWRYYAPVLNTSGVLTVADRDMLRLACEALAQIDDIKEQQAAPEYRRVIISVLQDADGGVKVKAETNPLDAQRRQWHQIARLTMAELGLTPSSRTRIGVPEQPKDQGDAFSALQQRRQMRAV